MELLVSYLSPQNKAKASSLAKKLDLIFLPQEDVDIDKYCESYFLIYQPTSSYIQKGTRNLVETFIVTLLIGLVILMILYYLNA